MSAIVALTAVLDEIDDAKQFGMKREDQGIELRFVLC